MTYLIPFLSFIFGTFTGIFILAICQVNRPHIDHELVIDLLKAIVKESYRVQNDDETIISNMRYFAYMALEAMDNFEHPTIDKNGFKC